jgi:hypothetical protein
LQKDLDILGKWTVENGIKITPVNVRQQDLQELGLKIHWVTPLVTKKFREQAVVYT